jgi:hypothetical protein
MPVLTSISVADEVWIAVALLHREHPERRDFEKAEILERAEREGLVEPLRPGVSTHVSSHAVAGKKPQPNDYRMLVETERGRRRLYRDGDYCHPERRGKIAPSPEDLPSEYLSLLDWYASWRSTKSQPPAGVDPFLKMQGIAKGLWGDKDAVAYVRKLREG